MAVPSGCLSVMTLSGAGTAKTTEQHKARNPTQSTLLANEWLALLLVRIFYPFETGLQTTGKKQRAKTLGHVWACNPNSADLVFRHFLKSPLGAAKTSRRTNTGPELTDLLACRSTLVEQLHIDSLTESIEVRQRISWQFWRCARFRKTRLTAKTEPCYCRWWKSPFSAGDCSARSVTRKITAPAVRRDGRNQMKN